MTSEVVDVRAGRDSLDPDRAGVRLDDRLADAAFRLAAG